MIRFTIEEENLLAILQEGLDNKQTLFELDRLYHLEEDEAMQSLILQCKRKIEGIKRETMENYTNCIAEEIS